jgi:hypothetical protein
MVPLSWLNSRIGTSIMRETLAHNLTIREPVATPPTLVSTARVDGHAVRVGVSKASSSSGHCGVATAAFLQEEF